MQTINKISAYLRLMRLDKPTGLLLLFLPCSWGILYADQSIFKSIEFLLLFLMGSVIMRSAGCIINDLVDRNLDSRVERTIKRPLASGEISPIQALLALLILLTFGAIILLQLNVLTIYIGIASMSLIVTYPFMKRLTYFPQVFLGLTFNIGIIMGYTAITNEFNPTILILYLAGIFFTTAYDTIYAFQDIDDDKKIGIKSAAIFFENKPKFFLLTTYSLAIAMILYALYIDNRSFTILGNTFLIIAFGTIVWMVNQISYPISKKKKYGQFFNLNILIGLLLSFGIMLT